MQKQCEQIKYKPVNLLRHLNSYSTDEDFGFAICLYLVSCIKL